MMMMMRMTWKMLSHLRRWSAERIRGGGALSRDDDETGRGSPAEPEGRLVRGHTEAADEDGSNREQDVAGPDSHNVEAAVEP